MMHILHIKQCSYKKAATKLIVVISLHINRMRVSREISRTVLWICGVSLWLSYKSLTK